jgi:hypothetical protein
MNDEIEARRAAKLRALKSGCCMWSPILPPEETEEASAASEAGAGAMPSSGALNGTRISPELAPVD